MNRINLWGKRLVFLLLVELHAIFFARSWPISIGFLILLAIMYFREEEFREKFMKIKEKKNDMQ